MSDPSVPVAKQFDAYNRHDLAAFVACFAEDFQSYRMPALQPSLQGLQALGAFYAEHRFNNPELRAELISRTVLGNLVFDHERIHGIQPSPVENMAVFEVENALIKTAWFYLPDATPTT